MICFCTNIHHRTLSRILAPSKTRSACVEKKKEENGKKKFTFRKYIKTTPCTVCMYVLCVYIWMEKCKRKNRSFLLRRIESCCSVYVIWVILVPLS